MRRFETRETWILRINRKRNDPYEEEEEMDLRAMGKKNERENAHYRSMFAQRHPPPSGTTQGRSSQLPQKPTNRPWCHPEALRGQPQPVLLCVSTARCKLHHHLVSIQRGKPTHWSRAGAAALTFGYDEYIFLFALLIRYRSCYAPIHTPC